MSGSNYRIPDWKQMEITDYKKSATASMTRPT